MEIFSETDNATIYYTLNGEEPDENSDVYTTPLVFTENTTLKARAYKETGFQALLQLLFMNYRKRSYAVCQSTGWSLSCCSEVTLSCSTPESVIRFTTDGSEPNENSDLFETADFY